MLELKPEVEEEEIVNILVLGVGGGGNNAVERMVKDNVKSVKFVCVNTDKMVLNRLEGEGIKTMQIGEKVTGGRGAGAKPEKGQQAAEENKDEIDKLFDGVQMVFVTCGMGGGTGTGAAPVIAKIAKEKGILTVGVVTKPFMMEGGKRKRIANEGIEKLREVVDTLIVIPNDKIFEIPDIGKKIGFDDAFHKADEILRQGVQGITDIIQEDALINLDFADVESVMRDKGIAHLGIGYAEGENRCMDAMIAAINNPLLETTISGASDLIINITGEVSIFEANEAVMKLNDVIGNVDELNTYFGVCNGNDMQDKVMVTVIATGMPENRTPVKEEKSARPSFSSQRRTSAPQAGQTLRPQVAKEAGESASQSSMSSFSSESADTVKKQSSVPRSSVPVSDNAARSAGSSDMKIPGFLQRNKR